MGVQGRDIKFLINQVRGLDIRLEGVEQDVRAIKEQQDVQGRAIIALQHSIVSVENRLGTVESRLDTLDSRLGAVESRLDTLDSRLDTLG